MCTQCIVNPFYYGDIAPGWFLIRARREETGVMEIGDWGLVECDNPNIVFKTTPFIYADKEKLFDAIGNFSGEMFTDIEAGYRLYSAMEKVKININSRRLMVKYHCFGFNSRFYMYLADYIANSNPETSSDPFPDSDKFVKHDYSFNPRLPYDNELSQ
jgi:hypothetical protein